MATLTQTVEIKEAEHAKLMRKKDLENELLERKVDALAFEVNQQKADAARTSNKFIDTIKCLMTKVVSLRF